MAREIGGYRDYPDWPKLGPSLLIASCLILAIRTAKWAASNDGKLSTHELDKEIDYAVSLADSVLSKLLAHKNSLFPQKREVWHQPDDDDIPKKKQKGGFSFEIPPFASDFSKT